MYIDYLKNWLSTDKNVLIYLFKYKVLNYYLLLNHYMFAYVPSIAYSLIYVPENLRTP